VEEDEMAKERKPEEMTEEEIAAANGEPLPDREAMSLIHGVQPLPQPILDPMHGGYTIDPPPTDEA
jgi:hypothetical protein